MPSEIMPGRTGQRHSCPFGRCIKMMAGWPVSPRGNALTAPEDIQRPQPTSGGYRIFFDVTQLDPESAQ
jgi:hypothetical protein